MMRDELLLWFFKPWIFKPLRLKRFLQRIRGEVPAVNDYLTWREMCEDVGYH